jgi:hypothetical protein
LDMKYIWSYLELKNAFNLVRLCYGLDDVGVCGSEIDS